MMTTMGDNGSILAADKNDKPKNKAWVFDFDGTLTKSDTFVALLIQYGGRWRLLRELTRLAPILLLMKLRLYDNGRAKERLFAKYFNGMRIEVFDELCRRFAKQNADLVRREAQVIIRAALDRAEPVYVVSASIENWVLPIVDSICDDAENISVVSTRIEIKNGIVTGRFLTPNCYGREKVRRLADAFPDHDKYILAAYGDSRGDRELLAYADERHYNFF